MKNSWFDSGEKLRSGPTFAEQWKNPSNSNAKLDNWYKGHI